MLEPIFSNHPSWLRMKTILSNGSTWSLSPDDSDRLKDINAALEFENHKGAEQQQELLHQLVKDYVIRGFAVPLPLNKIKNIPGVILALLNIQLQNTINERGKIIPRKLGWEFRFRIPIPGTVGIWNFASEFGIPELSGGKSNRKT
jgi:hypothetical protein